MLGWDCITPLKAQLGEPFRALDARLQSAIDTRYRLPEWTPEAYAIHKRADGLAAASEAFHVVGWSRADMRKTLRIAEAPLLDDPLSPCGFAPWEPWPPRVAQRLFIQRFNALERAHQSATRMIPFPDFCPFPPLRWSRTSCQILMMSPLSTLTQRETLRLMTNGPRSPANRLAPPPDHPQRDFADGRASFDAVASSLTKTQIKAASHPGSILVLAGAGTAKPRR